MEEGGDEWKKGGGRKREKDGGWVFRGRKGAWGMKDGVG